MFVKTKNSAGQNTIAYYHHDHLGTPIQATDRSGIVVWSAQYNAFGRVSVTTPTATDDKLVIESNLRFPGQLEDVETGLYYNWHRYYDPEVGRYVTGDPIGLEGGVNFYSYVNGNPVNLIDPLGNYSATLPIYRPLPIGPVIGYCIANPILCAAVGVIVVGIIITNPDDGSHAGQRQKEYQRMKDDCDKKPKKTGNKCSDLSREIDHYQNCASWYEYWDKKWNPGRHAEKIQNWRNRVQTLKDQYNKECRGNQCL